MLIEILLFWNRYCPPTFFGKQFFYSFCLSSLNIRNKNYISFLVNFCVFFNIFVILNNETFFFFVKSVIALQLVGHWRKLGFNHLQLSLHSRYTLLQTILDTNFQPWNLFLTKTHTQTSFVGCNSCLSWLSCSQYHDVILKTFFHILSQDEEKTDIWANIYQLAQHVHLNDFFDLLFIFRLGRRS